MDMKKKLTAVLIGLPVASASVFAGELNSFTHEYKINDYNLGTQKDEWTLGRGSYKLNDKLTFIFDVDKDFVSKSDGTETQGWDTQFGLTNDISQIGGFDVSLSYLIRYDASWNADDGSEYSDTKQYIFTPWLSKDVTIAGKEFSLGIELWAQVGNYDDSSLEDISGIENNYYLDGSLSDNWTLNLAWYNFNYYDGAEDEYDYQIGTENYLTYSKELNENFTFSIENYFEAYYTPDSKDSSLYAHIAPEIRYSKKINETISWHAAVSYDVVKFSSSNDSDGYTDSWNNNELEITFGIKM